MAALEVWMNGEHVGVWSASRSGVPTFRYSAQWVAAPAARALSLSLPITAAQAEHRGAVVAHYFDNLLPDSEHIRKRLATRFNTRSTGAFELLAAIGRDCVGAVQLLPEGLQPEGWDRVESDALNEQQVERILNRVTSDAPFGLRQRAEPGDIDADFRISIAGAQEKTALLRIGETWHRPRGTTPTTHILKLPLGLVGNMRADLSYSVENEWLCAQIVRELGLEVAATEMAVFGSQKALVVERFDRRWQRVAPGAHNAAGFVPPAKAWIARLPQEDLCQATGTAPAGKYEADGGPGMAACLRVLAGSEQANVDRSRFVLSQLAFWLLAATDGHAKNFSVFHRRGATFAMTPLYDVISAWPIIGEGPNRVSAHAAKLAMALHSKNTHYRLRDIRARHWFGLAQRCGVEGVWPQMIAMVADVDAAFERVQALLPNHFPLRVWRAVQSGTKRHARQFLREASALR
jgi:serine/threonine-protein kinase HipA